VYDFLHIFLFTNFFSKPGEKLFPYLGFFKRRPKPRSRWNSFPTVVEVDASSFGAKKLSLASPVDNNTTTNGFSAENIGNHNNNNNNNGEGAENYYDEENDNMKDKLMSKVKGQLYYFVGKLL